MAKEIEKQQFDIMNHDLVPIHQIITDREKEVILKIVENKTNVEIADDLSEINWVFDNDKIVAYDFRKTVEDAIDGLKIPRTVRLLKNI